VEQDQRLEEKLQTAGPDAAVAVFDTGSENLYDDTPSERINFGAPLGIGGTVQGSADVSLIDTLSAAASLSDHLRTQVSLSSAPTQVRELALRIVAELDSDGFLRTPIEEIAEQFSVTAAMVESALDYVQACEPVGVGARNVAECLALQLKDRNRLDPAARSVLDNLRYLALNKHAKLRKISGLSPEDLADLIKEIRALNPRPAAAFSNQIAQLAQPDVRVTQDNTGNWRVELNTETLPRVLINNQYAMEISRSGEEARLFIAQCREKASWLLRAMDQRAQTILRVSSEIVRLQQRFFMEGISGLRPLKLQTVADELNLHESTVSRVTNDKYLMCAFGQFELKFFFSQALQSALGGEAHASTAVREKIRKLIEAEQPTAPLSDDKIVSVLRKDGIEIARRTVAKYREALRIPSSVQRKRQKLA
jgi:RNA polymerase sigma-54 factor